MSQEKCIINIAQLPFLDIFPLRIFYMFLDRILTTEIYSVLLRVRYQDRKLPVSEITQ